MEKESKLQLSFAQLLHVTVDLYWPCNRGTAIQKNTRNTNATVTHRRRTQSPSLSGHRDGENPTLLLTAVTHPPETTS